ncbi:hypothetical protein EUTSA_v10009073mg [Eutrema salsugineum]|uniref:Uncharacterized protein n=1 Tax=Eutrema salsugineum TaxID=72664 RepID=V4MUK1_EUTSA|nr:hypothetical protein EUTSA_v10009073mg [Eutrema salsugineum]
MKNLSIFLFIFALCIHPFEGSEKRIYIRNSLAYKKWLRVHCESRSIRIQNLGVHYLRPGGNDYHYSFLNNAYRPVQIVCKLSKGADYKISKEFVAYQQTRSTEADGSPFYNYQARDDGIYHSTLASPSLKKIYNWN